MEFVIFGVIPMALLSIRNCVGSILFVLYSLLLLEIYGDVAIGNMIAYSIAAGVVGAVVWMLAALFRR
jgi:hypothetical protein